MKNRVLTLAGVIGLLACSVVAWAQTPTRKPEKVGIINIQQAISECAEGKKAFSDLQQKYRPRQEELQHEQQEIQSLQSRLQKQGNTLSDAEQGRLTRELEEKQKLFKRAADDASSDYRMDGQDVVQRIGKKMIPIIDQYAKDHNYALIFDPAAAQVPVYYMAKEVDVTRDIVKAYDAAHPVASASAPASAAPASKATKHTVAGDSHNH